MWSVTTQGYIRSTQSFLGYLRLAVTAPGIHGWDIVGGRKIWEVRVFVDCVLFQAQITWQWRLQRLVLGSRIHNIHCLDPLYVLGKRSKPIGCQINLILNSWRFPQYVLWAGLADISPMWPQRNTSVPIGVCSWWYFDYSWQKPLSWLSVYFWLADITLAILNSICKTMLDDFQFLPSTYNPYRLSR